MLTNNSKVKYLKFPTNIFIYLLITASLFFLLGIGISLSTEKGISLTQYQRNFADKINNEDGFFEADWTNTYVLDLTMKKLYYGLLTKSAAKRQAVLYATQGYLYTGKNICIKIIDPENGELAYECVGEHSEI